MPGMFQLAAGRPVQSFPAPAGPTERGAQYGMMARQAMHQNAQQRAALPDMVAQASAQFQQIGTPQAMRIVQGLQTNPKAIDMYAQQFGGWGKMYELMQNQAVQERSGMAASQAYGNAGMPDLAALAEVDPSLATNVANALKPGGLYEIGDTTSPTGTRFADRAGAIGQAGAPPSGFSFRTGPDGQMELVSGRGAGMGGGQFLEPTKSTTTSLQNQVLTADDAIARLDRIEQSYDPSGLTYTARMGDWFLTQGWKLDLFDLTEEQARGMSKRAIFHAATLDDINRTIKDITGAQMNKDEAERIIPTRPNLEMAGPVFRSMLGSVREQIEDYRDRRVYLLRTGQIAESHDFEDDGVPMSLYTFKEKREKRGDVIAAGLKELNPQVDSDTLSDMVWEQLDAELSAGVLW